MVVVHTGLELGATIYLDYSVVTRPGYLPGTGCVRAGGRAFPNQGICVFAVSARKQTSAL